ncbi:uncharacterized protein MYCFIDRAFT_81254 [Pseudocercospora fijiensis CIRAD86]|uniref:Uncharacterized protein n=1 Tax=Pseudocercospora fijiensis (strain CIRAD86) TaxID=383855 RepID=M2ZL56_PSEFD|nr:uncharacterized protein MYCFIDRAFT_81254 [Pseudocercospora fijiensis CIRAD86]EME79789.1 hypothetical protein MYCFIDRAFT_81254 [Pseudocercospora fijiensis CIRAD86]
MTFRFFHLPREIRDRIYCHLRTVGSFSLERYDGDVIKASIDVKVSPLHLLVSKQFKNEFVAVVFSGATLALGPTSLYQEKRHVLPALIIDNVKTCKVDFFVPYGVHKVQKEVRLNTICDADVFLDLPIEEGERIGDVLDFDDDQDEEGEDFEDVSEPETEWEDTVEGLDFSDCEDADVGQTTPAPAWLFRRLSQLRALQSVELIVTSGEPMPAREDDGPADTLQLIATELKDLLRVPLLSKLDARRVVVKDYGFHDTKFAGVQRCGIWTAESGWRIPEEVQAAGLELGTDECTGWRCGDPTCLGIGSKHPYPRKWFKTPQQVERELGKQRE